jgi:hypothetical protein
MFAPSFSALWLLPLISYIVRSSHSLWHASNLKNLDWAELVSSLRLDSAAASYLSFIFLILFKSSGLVARLLLLDHLHRFLQKCLGELALSLWWGLIELNQQEENLTVILLCSGMVKAANALEKSHFNSQKKNRLKYPISSVIFWFVLLKVWVLSDHFSLFLWEYPVQAKHF